MKAWFFRGIPLNGYTSTNSVKTLHEFHELECVQGRTSSACIIICLFLLERQVLSAIKDCTTNECTHWSLLHQCLAEPGRRCLSVVLHSKWPSHGIHSELSEDSVSVPLASSWLTVGGRELRNKGHSVSPCIRCCCYSCYRFLGISEYDRKWDNFCFKQNQKTTHGSCDDKF